MNWGKNSYTIYKVIRYLKDKDVSIWKKLLFWLPLVYFVAPIDLVPDYFFPFVGWLDDTAVAVVVLYFVRNFLANYQPGPIKDNENEDKDDEKTVDLSQDDYDVD